MKRHVNIISVEETFISVEEKLPCKGRNMLQIWLEGSLSKASQSAVARIVTLEYSSNNFNPVIRCYSSKDSHYSDDKTIVLTTAPVCLHSSGIPAIL